MVSLGERTRRIQLKRGGRDFGIVLGTLADHRAGFGGGLAASRQPLYSESAAPRRRVFIVANRH